MRKRATASLDEVQRYRKLWRSLGPTRKEYQARRHTKKGARWMVEQDTAEPPKETPDAMLRMIEHDIAEAAQQPARDEPTSGFTEAGARAMVEQAALSGDETPVTETERKRAKQLDAPAPNPALINVYLQGAHPMLTARQTRVARALLGMTQDAVYRRPGGKAAAKELRAACVRALHHLWRRWRAEASAAEAAARVCIEAQRKKAPAPAYVPLADGALHHPLPSPDETTAIEAAIQQRREHWIDTLGAPPFFDGLLQVFFERAGRIIFASPDPSTAMRDFWEGVPVKGRRKEDNVNRDRKITTAVLDRIDAGEKLTHAVKAVASTRCISPEAVWTIYYAHHKEERAVRGLRALLNSE